MDKRYIGHSWQGGGAMRFTFAEGRANGTKAVMVRNGLGLSLTLLEDRCLDVYQLEVKGVNIPYLSPSGPVHPAYYDAAESEWLRSFGVGFLATCGLTQAGEPCRFNDAEWGLHGPASNIPAQNVSIEEDDDAIRVSGDIRQYKFQTENLLLRRSVTISKTENKLAILDTISNEGWKEAPLMVLYHFNFGYPLLNENSQIILPDADTQGWNEYSDTIKNERLNITGPDPAYREQTFIHKLKNRARKTGFMVSSGMDKPEVAVMVTYSPENLPYLTQWKHLKPGEYVMALEPCNNHVKGAAWENENNTLEIIKPGEEKRMEFEIYFSADGQETTRFIEHLKAL